MIESNEFTIIYFDYGFYTENKSKIQKLRMLHGLKWNQSKVKIGIHYDEILSAYELFGMNDKIIKDENLKGRTGSVGIWENTVSDDAIKIIMFDKKNEDEHLPILLVYKGSEEEFYKKLIELCVGLGCTLAKVVEIDGKFEELFKRKLNVELVEKLKNVELSKATMKENFINKIEEFKRHGHKFSDSFVAEWIKCIYKYGYYSMNDLLNEIKNKKRLDGDNMIHSGYIIQDKSKDNVIREDASKTLATFSNNAIMFKKRIFTVRMKKNIMEN